MNIVFHTHGVYFSRKTGILAPLSNCTFISDYDGVECNTREILKCQGYFEEVYLISN